MTPEKNGRVTIVTVYNLLKEMEEKIDKHYVTKNEFKPVKLIVYGMTAIILGTVLTAVVTGVVSQYAPVVLSKGGL